MTRQDFEDICTMGELMDLCSEEGCWVCDDVYYEDSFNDAVNEELSDRAGNDDWMDVRDWLTGLPDTYDYYRRDSYGEWYGIGDYEFDDYKNEVEQWMDENDRWEYEEEEAPYEDPYDETPTENEDLSIIDLMMSGNAVVEAVRRAGASEETIAEIEKNFADSISEMIEKGA